MKNEILKIKIAQMRKSTIEILNSLFADTILEMKYRNYISKDILERITLVYLSIFGDKSSIEYEELSAYEKNIIFRIISKGIASIYVDNEYMNKENIKEKSIIINDMINFLYYLTKTNRNMIKRLVSRDIKIYVYKGWKWDFI